LTLALAVAGWIYLRGWFRLRAAQPNLIPVSRVAAFMGGLLSVWLATGSPIAALDHQLLVFHMVKHLLLMAVAAPLILLGMPALLLTPAALARIEPARASGGWLVLCWLAGTATVIGWHIPVAFQLALGSQGWHAVENASFLLAGLLFWWPVVEPWPAIGATPRWSIPLYLFLATIPCDILSAFLAFSGRVVYPSYLAAPGQFHLSPLDDQQFAGALMWVAVTFIYVVPAIAITVRMLSPRVPLNSEVEEVSA
jgi:cytochrome c oxidase assembly factor CtaG